MATANVMLIGHSEGGTIATKMAQRLTAITGLVTVNAALFDVLELVVIQLQCSTTIDETTRTELLSLFERLSAGHVWELEVVLGATARYWSQWSEFTRAAGDDLRALSVPTLLVQSGADENFSGAGADQNRELLVGLQGSRGSLQIAVIDGVGHRGFSEEALQRLLFIKPFVDWICVRSNAPSK
jgi:pimeloyl-ACP methyl ester carboxylesterase